MCVWAKNTWVSHCSIALLSLLLLFSWGSFRSWFFLFLYLQFKEITYGLQKTNASTLLRSCLEYVMSGYHRFLPGEGGYLLDLLQNVRHEKKFISFRFLFYYALELCLILTLSWGLYNDFYDNFFALFLLLTNLFTVGIKQWKWKENFLRQP